MQHALFDLEFPYLNTKLVCCKLRAPGLASRNILIASSGCMPWSIKAKATSTGALKFLLSKVCFYLPNPAKQWIAILPGPSYFGESLFTLVFTGVWSGVSELWELFEGLLFWKIDEKSLFLFLASDLLTCFTKANHSFTTALGGFFPSGKTNSYIYKLII